ncbi:MAG: preprotein translocase subunit SecA [Candidatus Gracilibacteria bacterium]|nr:preprotein translocase subunit SecA [Candidatus Gracilibacteria bacterium]
MIEKIINSIFGDPNEKKIKEYRKIVEQIKEKEKEFENLDLVGVKVKTNEFRELFSGLNIKNKEDHKKIREIINSLRVPAFALVKQACKLINGKTFVLSSGKEIVWNMIPYDVQLIGGLAINDGNISEMKTGEGKTLVATLPAYLNALTGTPVHIVTVNDYLATRDSEEMGILYNALGMTVGVITHNQGKFDKKDNYKRDIVYATNNELGFDYLRDNMVIKNEDKAQGDLFFAIIDEVDSILVDEARTPLIISRPDSEPTSKYEKFAKIVKQFEENIDYKIDEKGKTASLTEAGIQKLEKILGVENIYISNHYNDIHHLENALKANAVYKIDKDYIVNNGEVLIVDEFTGRVLSGRRYSEGLHQAIEAKEGVEIQQESKTLASITFQNYFRLYWKLAGMTGTAKTEEEEFYKVYGLETIVIPTNKPISRIDEADLLFKNEKGKYEYLVKLISELHEKGQPILVGTVSVDKSEYLSEKLKEAGIPHNVLNAKQHEREAEIVARAGQKGAVTIATNMAGRGTDIKLGEGVVELGGLIIIGTEKHETRRIDNQLRGRAGRQGDPGMTQFLISPTDDIMRIFGGDKLFSIFNSPMFASLPDNEPLAQSGMLTKRVTSVQKQVEGHNFDIRKHVLEYDDVINKHREIIYSKRNKILDSENIEEDIKSMMKTEVSKLVSSVLKQEKSYDWDISELISKVNNYAESEIIKESKREEINSMISLPEIINLIFSEVLNYIEEKKNTFSDKENFYSLERRIVLQSIDELWMEHIDAMSKLREAVAFEGYAQRNPLVVYKEKAFEKFIDMMSDIGFRVTKAMLLIRENIELEEKDLSQLGHEFTPEEQEEILKNLQNSPISVSNANPLFADPNLGKQKIRV